MSTTEWKYEYSNILKFDLCIIFLCVVLLFWEFSKEKGATMNMAVVKWSFPCLDHALLLCKRSGRCSAASTLSFVSFPYLLFYFQQYVVEQQCSLGTRHYGIEIASENISTFERQSTNADINSAIPLTSRSDTQSISYDSADSTSFIVGLRCKSRFAGQVRLKILFAAISTYKSIDLPF